MNNRTIAASAALLIALFVTVTAILPGSGLETKNLTTSYMEKVFDKSKVTTVDITLNPKDLESILENPLDEEMVEANVKVNGVEVDGVGLRTKGNMTLRSVAQMEDSDRYSFKIDFDYYNDDQNLYGLKKLNLNNNYSDPSLMREYLSYDLMSKMGLPTPDYSYMYVTINGKEWGLYLGVEAIEEPFLQRNFEDWTGDLYKPEGTGSDLKWISDDIKDYSGLNLKTNKNSKQKNMMRLLDVINHGGDLEDVANVDEMLRYFAVNTALVNLDSYQGSMKHNYYLYEEKGKFSILPWDYNMAFGGFGVGGMGGGMPGGMGGMPDGMEGMPDKQKDNGQNGQNNNDKDNADPQANQPQAAKQQNRQGGNRMRMGGGAADMAANFMSENNINFSVTTPVSGTTLEDRPLLQSLLSVDQYREKYNQYLQEIVDQHFTENYVQSMTTQISKLITPYVEKDPTKFYTTEQFTQSVSGDQSLVAFAVQRAASIKAQLSGDLVVEAITGGGGGPGGGGQLPDVANAPDANNWQNPDVNKPNPNNGEQQAPPDGQNFGDMQPPNMGNGDNQGNMQRPEWANGRGRGGGMGDMPPGIGGHNETESGRYTVKDILVTSGGLVLLIGFIVYAFLFQRRRT